MKEKQQQRRKNRRGVTGGGGQGAIAPLYDFRFFFFFFACQLSAQRSVMTMMIIPLPHYDNFWEGISVLAQQ